VPGTNGTSTCSTLCQNNRLTGIVAFALGLLLYSVVFRSDHFPTVLGASQQAPKFRVDPDWSKPLPNKWKIGGITGLAVDKDDNVSAYDRPNDLTDIERRS
jgi:hypothetical protein